ncbi:apolipoprotein N-acyltransferase [Halomonas sp. I1]|uniref:apolipoprotein N-acyltransferase n=1 Tax=Halomonas sp. I1 TaxID=393536 RepID=UPI0028DFB148|nr:apolipoprotein N-acyltransferase [Halomonas sp. I1]MDT8895347.1 apolipoprotein N-acyltransferase [Halomonas sp. I1]
MPAFRSRSLIGCLAAVAAGVLTTLSAAPFMLWWLAPVAAGLLYAGLPALSPRQAAWRGWSYGLGLFGTGTSWVYVSIHDYGYTGVPLAVALTALFVVALALFFAVTLWLYRRLAGPRFAVLTFAGAWVLGEALRTWLFTGFPWLLLGSGQVDSPLASWAPVGGVYLLSLIAALSGALGVELLRRRWWAALPLASLWLVPLALPQQWTQPAGEPVRVALLQGNLSQLIKWTPEGQRTAIDTYRHLTEALDDTPLDLVIWPEAALPMFEDQARPVLDSAQASLSPETQLLTGILQRDGEGNFYNSVIGLNGVQGEYRKRHLVPFGEYLPLESLLRGAIAFFDLPMPAMTPGPDGQAPMVAAGTRIGNAICYEIIYADLVANQARHAEVLLTLSNDTWFGDSLGPQQHLQMARLRALENGRYVVRATSNGVTAIIDPRGRTTDRLPQFEAATLIGEYTPMEGLTPFTRTGSWPVWLLAALLVLPGLRRKP